MCPRKELEDCFFFKSHDAMLVSTKLQHMSYSLLDVRMWLQLKNVFSWICAACKENGCPKSHNNTQCTVFFVSFLEKIWTFYVSWVAWELRMTWMVIPGSWSWWSMVTAMGSALCIAIWLPFCCPYGLGRIMASQGPTTKNRPGSVTWKFVSRVL